MTQSSHRRSMTKIIIVVGTIALVLAVGAIASVLYSNSITLGNLKHQCSELGVGTHAITYRGVATTLECDADGKMYLPARQ